MIHRSKASEILYKDFRDFVDSEDFKEHLSDSMDEGDDQPTIHQVFNALSSFVALNIKKDKVRFVEFFNFLEQCRERYHDLPENTVEGEFDNALCVSFLENLSNMSPNSIAYGDYIPYMGPLCREYLKAWDEFMGGRSDYLWTDEEWEAALARHEKLRAEFGLDGPESKFSVDDKVLVISDKPSKSSLKGKTGIVSSKLFSDDLVYGYSARMDHDQSIWNFEENELVARSDLQELKN